MTYADIDRTEIFEERFSFSLFSRNLFKKLIEYGLSLNIPIEQLDFWPNRFQDEMYYFI